jgi:hypothetical protein
VSRVSCIEHPARSRFVALRPHYVGMCDGNPCAALLLATFEHWTNVRLTAIETGAKRDRWVHRSVAELRADLCLSYGRASISAALEQLRELGLIERRRNPRVGYDRTWQYRLCVAEVRRRIPLNSQSPESDNGNAESEQTIARDRASDTGEPLGQPPEDSAHRVGVDVGLVGVGEWSPNELGLPPMRPIEVDA